MVSGDFASLYHKVLELFVNFSGRVLPREQVTCRFEVLLKARSNNIIQLRVFGRDDMPPTAACLPTA